MPVKKSESSRRRRASLKTGIKNQESSKKAAEKADKKSATKTIKSTGLTAPVYSLAGVSTGTLSLPKEIFGQPVNNKLLAQAMRVYLTNQSSHYSNTKTRGEVKGSTRKVYKQKGTGGARHGSVKAPIYVGGGIALGPKSRKTILDFPAKMKAKALVSALSLKAEKGDIKAIDGTAKLTGKTKELVKLMQKVNADNKQKVLLINSEKQDNLVRASKNIQNVSTVDAVNLNVFDVILSKNLILTKETVEKLEQRLIKETKGVKETNAK